MTDPWTRAALTGLAIAVATSCWPVYAGHTTGFFDHLVELVVLAALPLAGTRWRWAMAPLGALGVFVHEEFLVYGLPVLATAATLHAPLTRRGAAEVGGIVAPAVLAGLLVENDHAWVDLVGLQADLARTGVLSDQGVQNAMFHLQTPLADAMTLQGPLWDRLTRSDLAAVVIPPVALLGGWSMAWSWRSGLRPWALAWPLVVAPPLALHLVAWDTPRFTIMVVFQAWAVWCAVAGRWPEVAVGGRTAKGALAAAALVTSLNLVQSVPLMDGEVDGSGPLSLRTEPSSHSFEGCGPLFPNANFETGGLKSWHADPAFTVRTAIGDHGVRTEIGSEGRYWAGSYGEPQPDGTRLGDELQGTLISKPFEIVGETLLFGIGGGDDPEKLTVALVVDGAEVAVATGHDGGALIPTAWSTAAFVGKTGRIVITDASTGKWGHLSVDGFCWYRR